MTNQIAKKQMCVQMRSGVELWFDAEKMTKVLETLQGATQSRFISIEGRIVNSADIVGVFNPDDMADSTRRKNGQWKCKWVGNWHDWKEKCSCRTIEEQARKERIEKGIKECKEPKCRLGYIQNESGDMTAHKCIMNAYQ